MPLGDNPGTRALIDVVPEAWNPVEHNDGVELNIGRTSWMLRPIWMGEGYPMDVHRVLEEPLPRRQAREVMVYVARRMSKGARELLEHRELSWADSSGHALIKDEGGLLIARLAPLNTPTRGKAVTWSATTSAVIEAVLELHARANSETSESPLPRLFDLEESAHVSYSQVSRALTTLDAARYTEKVGAERGPSAGRYLRQPGRLLSDWASAHGSTARSGEISYHVPWRDARQTLALLDHTLTRPWAVTGAFAADLITPHLTQVGQLSVYVDDADLAMAAKRLTSNPDVTEVSQGGRLVVAGVRPHVLGLASQRLGVPVAPIVRVYADLLQGGERSVAAAEELRRQAIGF